MKSDLQTEVVEAIVQGRHGAPFSVLGVHAISAKHIAVRVFRPDARAVWVVDQTDTAHPMAKLDDAGFYEVVLAGDSETFRYRCRLETHDGTQRDFDDPYRFPAIFSDVDLYLHSEGRLYYSYENFGAHPHRMDGVEGVRFGVWAPNAQRVSVIGDFNGWDGRVHPMRSRGGSGIWELFIPNITAGALYRYDILSHVNQYHTQKSDPYAFYAEKRPNNASIVAEINQYAWQDEAWMQARESQSPLEKPMSIYEVHLGSWRHNGQGEWLTYRELADSLVQYVKDLNYTHIELMPIAEHPLDASWGYQVTGYFAVTSRYGTVEDFMYFVDTCHQNGIGVILDWVPAHFPKDGHGLSYFDGTHLYEHSDPRQGEHPDWGTYIFNYGRNEIRNFLIANALFWLKKYHLDGLRVDAVSSMLYLDFGREQGQWIPNEHGGRENLSAISFMKELNEVIHRECPGTVTIAEESTSWPLVSRPTYLGGLGFTLKWNMGWMHDILEYVKQDPVYRQYHHNLMTFSLWYAFSENFVLPLSHDEVVHLKGSLMTKIAGDWWQKMAGLRLLLGYQWTHPGKKLLFMGQEFGQWQEWSEERSLDWHLLDLPTHQGVQRWMGDLNKVYQTLPALYEMDFDARGFQWINANDYQQSVFSYLRFAEDRSGFVVVISNFTPVVRHDYRVGVPELGHYVEVLNSDAALYGGSDVRNADGVTAEVGAWGEFAQHIRLTLPPLAILVLRLAPKDVETASEESPESV
jgi:1,4-alpha-glucan branching enzyme